jgi:hypothetical protein
MFRSKLTAAAAFTTLAVALLGATPVGHAAGTLVPGEASAHQQHSYCAGTSKRDALAHGTRCQTVPVG